ncbi:MAG: hypothetical protein K8I30_10255 [Anaerolineae bacterium]|nr:hypothetical protein [Anaerolineae bacterium]
MSEMDNLNNPVENAGAGDASNGAVDAAVPVETANTSATPPPPAAPPEDPLRMDERLERLGGEPAPAITPEEFARLQKAGQVHIDARGRVRTARRSESEAGVSPAQAPRVV